MHIETLESRTVLSVSFDPGTGTLAVVGTSQNDTILIAKTADQLSVQVTLNGQPDGSPFLLSSINKIQVSAGAGNDIITNQIADKPVNVDGGTGTDTLIGPDVDSTWSIRVTNGGIITNAALTSLNTSSSFGNIESITGGAGDDSFVFSRGGFISAVIDGGAANNTLSFAGYTTPVSLILQTHNATGVGRFANIQSIVGGSANDTVYGPNQTNTWTIDGLNSVSIAGVSFSSFENLTGGSQADSFIFDDSGIVTGKIDGGSGSNSLDFSNYTTPVTFNLQNDSFSGISTGRFANVQSIAGSAVSMVNTDLIGPNATTTWNINGANKGANSVKVGNISFTNVDDLTGGAKTDTFLFANAAASISGTIDGNAGSDVLNYSKFSNPITVDLTANTVTTTDSSNTTTTVVGTFANLDGVVGSPNTGDTLIGPNANSTWTISGNNFGNVNGITFSSIENLTGGAMDDTFVFANGKTISGAIDGGAIPNPNPNGIVNTLDFSAYKTSIVVNLALGTANKIAGGVTNCTDVLGGSADDTLIGDANGNLLWGNGGNDTIEGGIDSVSGGVNNRDILVGGSGNDKITGGNGRDLILGGTGKDTLIGGDGDDILISGTTTFDTDGTTQDLISTFWNTPDSATSNFSTRVSQLRNGTTGVANMPILNSTTIFNDTSNDTLTGGTNSAGANDWYFAKISGSNQDSIIDFAGGDALN